MTNSLKKFVNLLFSKLDITIRRTQVEFLLNIINSLDDKSALREIRQETTFLVLLVRYENEERKVNKEIENNES